MINILGARRRTVGAASSLRFAATTALSGGALAALLVFATSPSAAQSATGGSGGGTVSGGGAGGSATGAGAPGGNGTGAGAGTGGAAGTAGTPNGGNGTNAAAGSGSGGGGGGSGFSSVAIGNVTAVTTGGNGGNGGNGDNGGAGNGGGGGGGAGGDGVRITATSVATVSATVTGGNGGNGGSGPFPGGGGGGGAGVVMQNANGLIVNAVVTGGTGANPLGGGGAGIVLEQGGSLQINANVTGGSAAGTAGSGAVANAAAMINISAGATVSGGSQSVTGRGPGGAGLTLNAGGSVTNAGTILGGRGSGSGGSATAGGFGSGGAPGGGNLVSTNGVGITGAGLTVTNAGIIAGGNNFGQQANAINFTGGVNILELQAGSTITGNVVAFSNADTFRLGGATNASFDVSQIGPAAQYRGFGLFAKTGTSNWTLTGTNTAVQPWTVQQGTLSVNGSLANSTFTVNNGGTLAGTGTVGNTLVSGGTFAPGSGTPGSSMTVNGTLGFNAAATYAVFVNPTTSSFANVSGAATLGGATVSATFANGSYIAKQYTILNAGSIGGTFGTLTNTNLPANFTNALSYDATHAYLNLTLNFTPPTPTPTPIPTPSAPDFGRLSGNQNNVANALINYFNSSGGIPMVFGTLTPNGLSQASGQPGASVAQTGITATGQFVNAIFDAGFDDTTGQSGVAGYAQGDDEAANAYAPKTKVARDAAAAFAKAMPVKAVPPSFASRWNVWASAYGGNSRVSGDAVAGTSTTTSRIFGTAVGATYRFTPDTQAGFALGGAGSNFGLDGGFGSGRADVFNAAVYAKHNIGAAYVAGLLGYSWQDTTTDRTVTIAGTDQLRANFKAQALTARLEGGWRYATPVMGTMVGITPYAALQSTSFYLPSYGEAATSGSNTFALNYASKTVTATRGELGAKFDKAMLVQGGVFTLKAKAAWARDWNTDRSATATFQTLPGATFTVNGAQPSANAALVSLGGEMKWHNGWTLAGSFDGEFSRTTAGYAGKGSVKYAW